MGFAREVGDSLVLMDCGVIVEQGEPRSVLEDPQHERIQLFLSKFCARVPGGDTRTSCSRLSSSVDRAVAGVEG